MKKGAIISIPQIQNMFLILKRSSGRGPTDFFLDIFMAI